MRGAAIAGLVGLALAGCAQDQPAVVAAQPGQWSIVIDRTFLAFFDWDSADLTERGRRIVAEFVALGQHEQAASIWIQGHADRSGPPAYNRRLSQRRAEAVAAELERLGVARGRMWISAFGEAQPLVPTADGIREPQNRRVLLFPR